MRLARHVSVRTAGSLPRSARHRENPPLADLASIGAGRTRYAVRRDRGIAARVEVALRPSRKPSRPRSSLSDLPQRLGVTREPVRVLPPKRWEQHMETDTFAVQVFPIAKPRE